MELIIKSNGDAFHYASLCDYDVCKNYDNCGSYCSGHCGGDTCRSDCPNDGCIGDDGACYDESCWGDNGCNSD